MQYVIYHMPIFLNFNYTNTSEYLFGTFDTLTHFIHGRIDLERTFGRINTMVFGIEDKENDVNSDLIPYQKYYQRVVKETGNEFEEFSNQGTRIQMRKYQY